jgi:hypothetical protein
MGALAAGGRVKRWLAPVLAVVLLVAAAIAILSYTQEETVRSDLTLIEIDGEVHVIGGDGKAEQVTDGLVLDAKDRVSTGLASRAVLAMGADSRIRLGPQAVVEVVAHDEQGVTLELEGGALQATVRPGPTALRIGSNGREVVATDATFEMGVGEDGTLVVEVSEGAAATSGMTGVAELHAGERATVSSQGAGVVTPVTSELMLAVAWPLPGKTAVPTQLVSGSTAPGALVNVRGGGKVVQVKADLEGKFTVEVPLIEGDNALSAEATDPLGKVASVDGVTILLKTKGPGFNAGIKPQ